MSSALSAKHLHNEEAAYAYVEERLWPNGPVCPHCGGIERISKMLGKATRMGLYKCYQCRRQFTVKIGTVFESSHVALHIWLQAISLIAASKKGISSNQLHRTLGVTLKTAWFMSHRIREMMRTGGLAPMGGAGGIVEVDETFIGRKEGAEIKRAWHHKMKVLSLVDRATGEKRSVVVNNITAAEIMPIVRANVVKEAIVMTDEASVYNGIAGAFHAHGVVNHSAGEYVLGIAHTNTIEGSFSIFKRGMKGIYQHCQEKHLHRYLAEFDFRYTNRIATGVNDTERADGMLMGAVGKRLTYQTASTRA